MICEKCGKKHNGTFGSGRFCSRSCANSRIISNDLKERISKKQRIYEKKFCKVCEKKLNYRSKTLLCKEHLYGEKKCSKCGSLLTKENSIKKNKGVQTYCKKCLYKIQTERWINRKKWAVKYKGGKCDNCGYNKYYGALEFHHTNPKEKEMGWTKMRLVSLDKLKKELDKCILLCANCHRERHGDIE